MKTSIYTRHRSHPDVIRRAVWMYFRFNLSFRDVEELMIERGVEVSYETVRRWVDKFGSTYAKRLRSRSESPSPVWHLDEVYTKINGKMVYLWRAVDDEGTVLDVVVQRRRNTKAATRLLRKLLKNQGVRPTKIVTDRLGSYGAALKLLGLKHLQDVGGRKNNRAEVLTFQYEGENERLRSYSPLTAKSTISSIIDVTSSLERHFENSGNKLKPSGTSLRLQLVRKKKPRGK